MEPEVSSDMEEESSQIVSQAYKKSVLADLFFSQKEAARFLEFAYLALKEDPEIARKVRLTADNAQNQHMRTHGLMISYQDTAIHVVKSMMPLLKKALEKKKVELIQRILEKLLVYVNRMITETEKSNESYKGIKKEVQRQISDIVKKNHEVESVKNKVEIEEKELQASLRMSKDEYDGLQVRKKELAEEIKAFKKKRHDFLEKSIQTEEAKKIESVIDGILIPSATLVAAAAGGPIIAGTVLFGSFAAQHLRRSQASKQAVDASDKVKEDIEKSEKTKDQDEKRMIQIKEDAIKKITMLRELASKKANEMDRKSLEKACEELGQVGNHFAKIVSFWENFAAKLKILIEEKDIVELLLDEIHDEDFKEDLDNSARNITEVWSSFRMVCAHYVGLSDREIHDLYSFLSEPVDQLSIEDCSRRKEEVLAKMENEVKALGL